MTILAFAYIIGICTLPILKPLRMDFLAWLLFGVYVLILLFVWGLSSKQRYDRISEEKNEQLNTTKDVLKERSKWYL